MRKKIKITLVTILSLVLVASIFAFHSGKKGIEIEQTLDASQTFQEEEIRVDDEPTQTEAPIKVQEMPSEDEIEIVPQTKDAPYEEKDREKAEQKELPNKVGLEETKTCTLVVRCDAVLKNLDKLTDSKKEIIPSDGVIFKEQKVEFHEGESAFDVIKREMKEKKIHFEFVNTPMYQSAYIEGIGNLFEFDCGAYSGWLYKVNGIQPTYGCSQYKVEDDDKIEFFYSCNLLEKNN